MDTGGKKQQQQQAWMEVEPAMMLASRSVQGQTAHGYLLPQQNRAETTGTSGRAALKLTSRRVLRQKPGSAAGRPSASSPDDGELAHTLALPANHSLGPAGVELFCARSSSGGAARPTCRDGAACDPEKKKEEKDKKD